MTDPGRILIVIPARGGSKRLPRKNVLPLSGKPLICWTIEAALNAEMEARIMVTSDDEEILNIARQYEPKGIIAHKRPEELATDTASTVDVIIDAVHAERELGHIPKTLILLQPTSPLRSANDVKSALKAYRNGGCKDTVVSVCEVDHPTAWIGTVSEKLRFEGIDLSGRQSQSYQKEYRLSGAVYVAHVDFLVNNRSLFTENLLASIMPRDRSVDIDEDLDFMICESIIERR